VARPLKLNLGCPVLRFWKGRAFDWVLKVCISIRDRCGPAWIPSSRRTVEPKAPPLKNVKDGAPQRQNLNFKWTYGSSISQ
jgi:hypothetical protein